MTYQTTMFAQIDPDVPLDENVIMIGDWRAADCLREMSSAPWICIDTEFYHDGHGPWRKRKDINYWKSAIRLIQVGLPSGRVLVFDLGGLLDDRVARRTNHDSALDLLRRVIENPLVPKAGMNLMCEYLLFRIHFGWKMRCMRDIMLMSQVYWAGVGSKAGRWTPTGFVTSAVLKHNMAAICDRLGIAVDKAEQTSDWAGKLTNKQINYAARDVIVPRLAWTKLAAKAKREGLMKSFQAECDAQPAFCECSYNGLPIDLDIARADIAKWEIVRDEFLKPFKEKFPDVNPSSPVQVAKVLTEALNHNFFIEKMIRGKLKQQPTTADDVLAPFAHVDFVNSLLEGRSTGTCMKWLQTAAEHAFDAGDGGGMRIRAEFKQIAGGYSESGSGDGGAGRGMGRSSTSRPLNTQNPSNLQPAHEKAGAPSVRRSIRPGPGRSFIVADLSQAHWRIAAQWSRDPVMLRDCNLGRDAHLAMTHRVMVANGVNLTLEEAERVKADKQHPLNKEFNSRRQGTKSTNYACINLSGADTLKTQMETMAVPVVLPKEEVQKLIDAWRELYCVLYSAQRQHIRKVNKNLYRFDSIGVSGEYGEARGMTGRRLYLVREWKKPFKRDDGTWSEPYWSVKGTDAVSFVWMSTEADLIKYAMGRLVEDFDAHPEWDVRWANFAHDEVDLDCKKEYELAVAEITQRRFQEAMQWAGIIDLPVDETGASPEKLIKSSWAAK
jgi:DNA polymerase I-like protein with 3'-5' exonuclease and polymerase domains